MREEVVWPLVERGLRAWLISRIPGLEVLTETGATVADEYLELHRAGGSGTSEQRRVAVELTACARARGRAQRIVRQVETAMQYLAANGLSIVEHGLSGLYVDEVDVDLDWADDPLPNQDVRRFTAQYALTIRPWAA